jgi:glycosyltransferase involved in cell wall biosynthesis
VLPSYANEGVPQALLQALLCALPAITTDVGSITEAAIDQHTALVVPTENAGAIADALRRLIEAPQLRAQLGQAARQHVAARFSRDSMIERMSHVFAAASEGRAAR